MPTLSREIRTASLGSLCFLKIHKGKVQPFVHSSRIVKILHTYIFLKLALAPFPSHSLNHSLLQHFAQHLLITVVILSSSFLEF